LSAILYMEITMLFIITVPQSKTSVAMSRVLNDLADALQTACGFLRLGLEGIAISSSGKRIEGRRLERACQNGELSTRDFV